MIYFGLSLGVGNLAGGPHLNLLLSGKLVPSEQLKFAYSLQERCYEIMQGDDVVWCLRDVELQD